MLIKLDVKSECLSGCGGEPGGGLVQCGRYGHLWCAKFGTSGSLPGTGNIQFAKMRNLGEDNGSHALEMHVIVRYGDTLL